MVIGLAMRRRGRTVMFLSPVRRLGVRAVALAAETARIQTRVVAVGGRLDTAAMNDKALTAVGLILFRPALFFLGGTKDQEAECGRLIGEYDAVQQAAIQLKCAPTPVPAVVPAASQSAHNKSVKTYKRIQQG